MSQRPAPASLPAPSKNTNTSLTTNGTLPRTRPRPRLSQIRSTDRGSVNGGDQTRPAVKEPHVKTTEYVLHKFRNKQPSLILHLYPTHFRFDQQDGTFGYNSPMKLFLEHLKAQTVPHDILEEILRSGVSFYDGCLIVEVHNHKSGPGNGNGQSASGGDLKTTTPFSIHNYNKFITPSPYSAYPWEAESTSSRPSSSKENAQDDPSKSMPAPARPASEPVQKKKVFTTVMHPTPQSLHREISLMATWSVPDTRGPNRRQSSISSRDGSSKQSAVPLTPLSAAPSIAVAGKGPAKRQKMMLEEHDIHNFESDVLRTTNTSLYLHPAESFATSQAIMKMLKDPLHDQAPPKSSGRKRTTAELAADEAQAAEEERIALIMDEMIQPSLSVDGANAGMDGRSKAPHFQPDFSRFKKLEDLRREHEEAQKLKQQEAELVQIAKRDAEAERKRQAEAQSSNANRQQQETLQQQQEQRAEQQRQQTQQHMHQHRARMEMQRQQAMAQQRAMQPQLLQQHMMQQAASQVQQGSPVIGSHAPIHSSPLTANNPFNQSSQAAPMASTGSVQNSPPRPGSAMPAPQAMVRGPSIQSHHSMSRNSTPQLGSATPQMMNRTMTPQPRPGQPNAMMNGNPAMTQAMLQARQQQQNGLSATSPQQQHAALMAHQNAAVAAARKRQLETNMMAAAQGQGSPIQSSPHPQFSGPQQNNQMNNTQMTPQQRAQFQQMQQAERMANYQRSMMASQRNIAGGGGANQQNPHMPSGNMPQHSAAGGNAQGSPVADQMLRTPSQMMQQNMSMHSPHPQQPGGMQARPQQQFTPQQLEAINAQKRIQGVQQMEQMKHNFLQSLASQHGGQMPPDAQERWNTFRAQQQMRLRQQQAMHAQQQQQQQQQQQHNPQQQNQARLSAQQQQQMHAGLMRPGQGLNLNNMTPQNVNNMSQQQQMMYQERLKQQQMLLAQRQGNMIANNGMNGMNARIGMNGGGNGMNGNMPNGSMPPGSGGGPM